MEEKTLEYYHLKIEQLLTSNESLNQEKSDLQDEAEDLQERIDEQIKLLTNILITLGITTTRAEGERLIQVGGVLKQVEKLKDRIDELEEDLDTAKANANSAFTMYQNAQDRINELESHDSMYKEICQLTGTQTNAEHFAKILTDYHKIKPLVSTYRTALEEIKRQFKGCVQTLALFECEKCDDPNCVYLIASKALEGGE